MTTNTTSRHLKSHRLATGVKAFAWTVALITVGYGMVKTPELLSKSTNEVQAMVPAAGKEARLVRATETDLRGTTQDPAATTLDERDDRADASRECSPEKGITNACIYE